jgi:hypothetical protein
VMGLLISSTDTELSGASIVWGTLPPGARNQAAYAVIVAGPDGITYFAITTYREAGWPIPNTAVCCWAGQQSVIGTATLTVTVRQ